MAARQPQAPPPPGSLPPDILADYHGLVQEQHARNVEFEGRVANARQQLFERHTSEQRQFWTNRPQSTQESVSVANKRQSPSIRLTAATSLQGDLPPRPQPMLQGAVSQRPAPPKQSSTQSRFPANHPTNSGPNAAKSAGPACQGRKAALGRNTPATVRRTSVPQRPVQKNPKHQQPEVIDLCSSEDEEKNESLAGKTSSSHSVSNERGDSVPVVHTTNMRFFGQNTQEIRLNNDDESHDYRQKGPNSAVPVQSNLRGNNLQFPTQSALSAPKTSRSAFSYTQVRPEQMQLNRMTEQGHTHSKASIENQVEVLDMVDVPVVTGQPTRGRLPGNHNQDQAAKPLVDRQEAVSENRLEAIIQLENEHHNCALALHKDKPNPRLADQGTAGMAVKAMKSAPNPEHPDSAGLESRVPLDQTLHSSTTSDQFKVPQVPAQSFAATERIPREGSRVSATPGLKVPGVGTSITSNVKSYQEHLLTPPPSQVSLCRKRKVQDNASNDSDGTSEFQPSSEDDQPLILRRQKPVVKKAKVSSGPGPDTQALTAPKYGFKSVKRRISNQFATSAPSRKIIEAPTTPIASEKFGRIPEPQSPSVRAASRQHRRSLAAASTNGKNTPIPGSTHLIERRAKLRAREALGEHYQQHDEFHDEEVIRKADEREQALKGDESAATELNLRAGLRGLSITPAPTPARQGAQRSGFSNASHTMEDSSDNDTESGVYDLADWTRDRQLGDRYLTKSLAESSRGDSDS